MAESKELIEKTVLDTLSLTSKLDEMMQSPEVKSFLEMQKSVNAQAENAWKAIEERMIVANIKQVKGDWGSLTITERLDFDVDEKKLAPQYKKLVPDTSKIRTIYQLENKPIAGANPKTKKFLSKRLKIGK